MGVNFRLLLGRKHLQGLLSTFLLSKHLLFVFLFIYLIYFLLNYHKESRLNRMNIDSQIMFACVCIQFLKYFQDIYSFCFFFHLTVRRKKMFFSIWIFLGSQTNFFLQKASLWLQFSMKFPSRSVKMWSVKKINSTASHLTQSRTLMSSDNKFCALLVDSIVKQASIFLFHDLLILWF